MGTVRMVHLRTVPTSFHAHVLAARLGAAGILTQLRGPQDGPYPIGNVAVFVGEDDLESARELLLADEVESAFELSGEPDTEIALRRRPDARTLRRPALVTWLAVTVLVLVWSALVMRAV
jgi:hypothetical protein